MSKFCPCFDGTNVYCPECREEQDGKQIQKLLSLNKELVKALEKTLASLASYKRYTPEPYKKNPVYIIGSVEAETLAVKALKRAKASASDAGTEELGDNNE